MAKVASGMTAMGHLRRSSHVRDMSALPPTAVELAGAAKRRDVPTAEVHRRDDEIGRGFC